MDRPVEAEVAAAAFAGTGEDVTVDGLCQQRAEELAAAVFHGTDDDGVAGQTAHGGEAGTVGLEWAVGWHAHSG